MISPTMRECPFRLGDSVEVICPKYRKDFPGEFLIVGLTWDYQHHTGEPNIYIASQDEIDHSYGATDGWTIDDLRLVKHLDKTESSI